MLVYWEFKLNRSRTHRTEVTIVLTNLVLDASKYSRGAVGGRTEFEDPERKEKSLIHRAEY